jgi:anhydro-N-acetylmuramic acid kinase
LITKRIVGLMSGTSVDGVDVAVVDVRGSGISTRFRVVALGSVPYSMPTRQLILSYLNVHNTSVAEISQLNFFIGTLFADAVVKVCRQFQIPLWTLDLIGSHGQTIYHQAIPSKFGGRHLASTMQLGEAAVIAERTGIPTVSDFRVRDVAAGGTGAPLVPYVDYLLLRHPRKNRAVLNIGGIANVTLLPRQCPVERLIAFDTGPGNMLLDAAASIRSRGTLRFDRDGALAACGRVNSDSLRRLLKDPYYRKRPPKAAGREQFGIEYTRKLLRQMKPMSTADILATLTEVTAQTVTLAIRRFSPARVKWDELIVSGGGARNLFLMSRLEALMPATCVLSSNEVGIDLDAKEAIAFAILANETWHHHPGNVPSVTGAERPVILGKITPA